MSVNAFTCVAMACRKLLMNIAVGKGAEEGKNFSFYVGYLVDKGHVTHDCRGWVNHIRDKGNEATHEIPTVTKKDAEQLVTFLSMLLKIMYEFPSKLPSPQEEESAGESS